MKLGWCTTGHHSACRVHVSNDRGGLTCGCPCHLPVDNKHGDSSDPRDNFGSRNTPEIDREAAS